MADVSHGYLMANARDLWPLNLSLVTGVFFHMYTRGELKKAQIYASLKGKCFTCALGTMLLRLFFQFIFFYCYYRIIKVIKEMVVILLKKNAARSG